MAGNSSQNDNLEDEFNTFDEKVEELICKDLTKINNLFALKSLFENPLNQFSSGTLRNSLITLADPRPFDFYDNLSVARLELHLRIWVAILEKICVAPMRLSKELRDNIYNSLAKFAEIHRKTTQVTQDGIYNSYKSSFSQFNQLQQDDKDDEIFINKRNYNIDFLLIHLRDTLHSLRDDETWFQEIMRRTKSLLKSVFGVAPQVKAEVTTKEVGSLLSVLTQLRKGLSFKYPVASYYVDWRIMLIIRHNLFSWSGYISNKFQEMVLMEYFWGYLEKEWIDVVDKSILDSQSKFEEVSNRLIKVLRNTGSFINDLAGNEPLVLPHTLWFGILDLAQNLIQNSTRTSTHGLCYYLAIESLNRAPSSFIQFKAAEILFHLYKINNQIFSIIEHDFDQYIEKLNENNSTCTDSSEKFKILLAFVKNKCSNDFNLLNNDIEKGKVKEKGKEKEKGNQIIYSMNEQVSKSGNILEIIADEMTCPISHEPTDRLCILKCQHILSIDNFKRLKQKECPECREKIDDDIRYLSQNVIYKYLYSQFSEAGHILPSIEVEDSANNEYESDSDDSEVDLILTKKKKILKAIKLNPNISLKSIFQIGNSKKQHQTYLSAIKELEEKNYKNAEHWCKEFLKTFPKSYSMRCILAYTYRCLNDYEQALTYLNEAIKLKEKKPIAWYISGEINFKQGNYDVAINDLYYSISYNTKMNNLYTMLGISHYYNNNLKSSLKNFKIALRNNSNNYLCLKYCAHIYDMQKKYSAALKMLDKLLSIDEKDSLILCYYGEILSEMREYENAITYFTKANDIDPENVHNLNKRVIMYYIRQEYDKALSDLNKMFQLDVTNSLAYYFYRGLIYYRMEDINNSLVAFEKCIELSPGFSDRHFIKCIMNIELKKYEDARIDLERIVDVSFVCLLKNYSDFWFHVCKFYEVISGNTHLDIANKFNVYMFKKHYVYFISNLYNLNENYQFQEGNLNSSPGWVLSFKENHSCSFEIYVGDLGSLCDSLVNIVWKINVKKINSPDVFVKFKLSSDYYDYTKEYILKYEDILKLEGLCWIEYVSFNSVYTRQSDYMSLSIEAKKDSIDMQVDYVRFTKATKENNRENRICFPKMDHLLPFQTNDNVPEAFEDKYFLRKETQNFLELNDIISNL
ncbi:hypothetical protein RclHR1_01660002 [Rhizophagus clarus]|uniref:Uncharacterized protein n=1 Tax=Rhizophagus clarus TaxID=94130 RepID=A0A2Z6QHY2_9GLOM|nr:hypothetical protein RclHR1_01660002 [Rhizophagus clarus]GES84490.1 hypothetical protein GLOIN_2v1877815 [Rhizophagus clarus]